MNQQQEYSNMVSVLFRDPTDIFNDLTPGHLNLWHAASGIAGEAGEVLDEVKKLCAYGRHLNEDFRMRLILEMGDLEFYLEAMRQALHVSRDEVLRENQRKLAKRYPSGHFTTKAANERKDVQS